MAFQAPNNNECGKKNDLQCYGCHTKLKQDHTGIVCLNSHHLCVDCSLNYVAAAFDEPSKYFPLKCSYCRSKIVMESFERQLGAKQLQTFILYNMQYDPSYGQFLAPNEIIGSCPFCPYWEINTKDKGRLMFLCKKKHCKKTSCFWCKKLITNRNNSNAEQKIDIDPEKVEEHFECAQLAPSKEIWDTALSNGQIVPCPKCHIGGQKDNACTHMRCVKCQTQFCYLCGKEYEKLDRAKNSINIMGHNVDWKINDKRCPLFLDNLSEIDKRWPKNDDKSSERCVAFLHQLRTKKLLQEAMKKIDEQTFKKLCDRYNIDQNCGFDLKEVVEGDHSLVIRKK